MKRIVLIGSTAILTVMGSPAFAQAAPQGEQTSSAEDQGDEIVVTGFRRSLEDALSRKEQATEVSEQLSAEDIGKLPDTSVAESLARLPGVSATREVAGAGAISIRGMGPVLTNGTLNGRDVASTSGDRAVPFSLFPAELIAGAGVYKAPSASSVEGGIAGTIDLRTVRPIDYGKSAVAINLRGRYNDLAEKLPDGKALGYRGSVTYIDQFDDDRFGIALGYAGNYAPFVSAESSIFNSRTVNFGGFIGGLPPGSGPDNDFNIPFGADNGISSGTSERHSFLGTAQFKPSETFETNIDLFYSDFQSRGINVGAQVEGLGSFGETYTNVQADGFNLIGGTATCNLDFVGDVNNCADSGFGVDLRGLNAIDESDSSLASLGWETKWSTGNLTLTGDFSYSLAKGSNSFRDISFRPYSGAAGSRQMVLPVASFGENSSGAAFLTSPLNFADAATNRVDRYRIFADDDQSDEIFIYKFDADYKFEDSVIRKISAGFRFVDRQNELIKRSASARLDPELSLGLSSGLVRGTFNPNSANGAFDANTVLVIDTRAAIAAAFPNVTSVVDPVGSHVINERVRAYYGQVDFDLESAGVPVYGNVGLRHVTTRVQTQGTSGVDGVYSPISTSDEYSQFLPSINLNFKLQEDLLLRVAASRAIARPPINFLSPGTDQFGTRVFGGAGGGGNPFLRPYVSDQVDVSVEKYFAPGSAITLAGFYKRLDTFITQARVETGPPANLINFFPANGSGGRIWGFEALVQHTFTNLLPEGAGDIGIYANYSYTKSNISLTETFNSSTFGLDGLSKHVANGTIFYENGGFGARVSYRYRSSFTRAQRPASAYITNRGEGDLSFQLSYDVNENLSFELQGYNLLNEPRDSYYGLESLQGQYRVFGRNLEFGVTYKF